MKQHHKFDPEFYEGTLSEEESEQRAILEQRLSDEYAALKELSGVEYLRAEVRIEYLEQQLAWQGANPKKLDFDALKDHIRHPHSDDPIENKYRKRIKNRATAIRAYCISCMGGDTALVRECANITCPMHPFRMGKDPFRGWDIPKAVDPEVEDDEDGPDYFEDGSEGSETDAE